MSNKILVTALLILVSGYLPVLAQENKGQYRGATSCANGNCHGSIQPRNVYDVKQNEYLIWLKQGKHKQTYDVLLNDRSARIARNMKLTEKPNKSAKCLNCHALNVAKDTQVEPLDLSEGVSCESCHGPSGGWIAKHIEDGFTHEMSVKAGMIDLRNPVIRAEVCLACHMGNSQKTIDHELIASGHPELIFELDNYSMVMPMHWLPYSAKRKKEGFTDTEGTGTWAVGQAVAFREGMLQLARRSGSASWPEFSEMNCTTCHHALKGGKSRQERGYKFKAGQPHWSKARFAMLRHVVSVFAPQERAKIDGQVEQLLLAISKMNTPSDVTAMALGLSKTVDGVIPKIVQAKIGSAQTRKLLDMIVTDVPYLIEADIHAVEQSVMAINALVSDMARTNPTFVKGEVTKVIDKLYEDIRDPDSFNPDAFSKHMLELQGLAK